MYVQSMPGMSMSAPTPVAPGGPITFPAMAAYQGLSFVLLFLLWWFIDYRARHDGASSEGIGHLQKFFFFFASFNLCLSAPFITVYLAPRLFPPLMAWGYVIGHVLAILSLSYLTRMTLAIVPRWAKWEKLAIVAWGAANAVYAGLNIWYVVLHNQPLFDNTDGMAHFEVPFAVGAALLVMSVAAYGPAIVLFGLSALRSAGLKKRLRALCLSVGMALAMAFTHSHALSHHQDPGLAAELLNAVGLILIALGVAISTEPTAVPASPTAPPAPPTSPPAQNPPQEPPLPVA